VVQCGAGATTGYESSTQQPVVFSEAPVIGRLVVRALAVSAIAVSTLQAQRGTIRGVITEAGTSRPLPHAQVGVVGTTAGAVSDNEGRYSLAVTPGQVTVRVIRIGYGQQTRAVTVTAGQTATADFQLEEVATKLNPIVTTATGQQRRIEVGNAIAQVNAVDIVETQAVSQMADLLVSKAAGVTVFTGVQTGAGTRIRIRGTSSLSLTNNPIFVIDGIRVEGTTGSSSVGVGGTTPSRLGDLNPEEIANIEVVRGPSASTLYGTDAANGVIVITTKRGSVGRPTWTTYTEQTAITDRNEYPTAHWGWRTGTTAATTSTPANTVQCFLSQVAANVCAQDSVTTYNLHNDKESTPYGTGYRKQYGAQLSGGTETIRYFLHGEYEDEDGVTKLPEFEKRYLAARNVSLSDLQQSPNHLTRMTGRANLNLSITQQADASVSVGYISSDLRLPRSDDSGVSGIAANTYGGPGFKYNRTTAGDTLYGWRSFTPRDIFQAETNQAIERLIASSSGNYRPQDWLTLRANVGLDLIYRGDTQLCRFENCPNVGIDRQGFKVDNRTTFYIYTVDASGTATRRLTDDIESKTTGGVQLYRNVFNRNGASSVTLPPGATTVTAGAVKNADETTSESRTLGSFLEQNIAYRDRLFLTGAVRSDRNSAFGADFKTVLYPKFSASWIPTEESFFPELGWLDELRFRSAYGASGVQPGTIDAVQFFTPTTARGEAGDQPAVVFSTLGNRQLKPERSNEIEVGFDVTAVDGRVTAEVTRYQKTSKDALISRILPPSLGTGATARLENLGQVRNQGWEALVTTQLMRGSRLGWELTINGSTNGNKLISLGGVPPIVGSTQSQKEGYPLYSWWSRQLTGFEDKNGNGIIEYNSNAALTEITVTDTNVFLGQPLPKRELAIANSFDFGNRRFRLQALVDYKGGHLVYNNTERIRCASRFNCAGLINPSSSLFEQARTVMVREHPSRSVSGFFEKGDFWRFREVSLAYTASQDVAGRFFRARNATISAAIRNVGILWTKYTGVDPEAFGTTGDAPSEFQAFGPPTYFSFRLNLNY
jgi:TonB-linked SusC/RagA family outer membrane protein